MNPCLRVGLLLLVSLLLMAGPGPMTNSADADSPAQSATRVMAIHAIEGEGAVQVDAGLKPLENRLKKVFPSYRRFRLASSHNLNLKTGGTGEVTLPNGDKLQLRYTGVKGGMVQLQMEIPNRLKTTVRVKSGGTFFQAGISHEGGILIIAVSPKV